MRVALEKVTVVNEHVQIRHIMTQVEMVQSVDVEFGRRVMFTMQGKLAAWFEDRAGRPIDFVGSTWPG